MNIRQYQYISTLNTGDTAKYEEEIIDYFKIDKTLTPEKVQVELEKKLEVKAKDIKKNYKFLLNKKWYKLENDFLESSYEQFVRLDILLAENKNINNLHKLLAIYCRPVNWYGKIKKYNLRDQDKIAEELLNLDMGIAQSIMVFFYLNAMKCLKYTKIHYLNEMKKVVNTTDHTKSK